MHRLFRMARTSVHHMLLLSSIAIFPSSFELEDIKLNIGHHISPNILQTIYGGYYEQSEMQLLQQHLSKNDTVMEVGAGIGFLSSYCAKQIGSDRVFAYEANTGLEKHIRENYKINSVNPSLEMCLVGVEEGEQEFYISKDFWSSSTSSTHGKNAKRTVISMKSFYKEVERINPSFVIIDIEGGEYDLFKESRSLHNIRKIIIEVHRSKLGDEKSELVIANLEQAGFRVEQKIPSSGDEILFLRRSLS